MRHEKQTTDVLYVQDCYLRLLRKEDAAIYYEKGFAQEDEEVRRFTGTTQTFSKKMIYDYVERITEADDRYDFLIFFFSDSLIFAEIFLIGEAVLNDIDWDANMAGFRIALFSSTQTNKGIGKQAVKAVTDFGLYTLQLHRIEVEVFDYNPRAQHVYECCGYQIEGRKKDGLYYDGSYHDILIMAILHP